MLTNHKLLIDKNCPMCQLYGKLFTATAKIDEETIVHYQTVESSIAQAIDMNRAKNEIAFYNTHDLTTTYGLDAILKILSHNSSILKWFFSLGIVYFILQKGYNFISYNRKLIYPVSETHTTRPCIPQFNFRYRISYIIFVALFTGCVLNTFAYPINAYFHLEQNWLREFYICFGQIIWQGAAISILKPNMKWDYLGNMSTVSLIGGILLLPFLLITAFYPISIIGSFIYFLFVVGIMLLEHIRRCKLLDIPIWMTFSWIAFRTFILMIILIPFILK